MCPKHPSVRPAVGHSPRLLHQFHHAQASQWHRMDLQVQFLKVKILHLPMPPPPAPSHAPPIEPEADCSSCLHSYLRRDMFQCPNPAAHLMCQECFESGVCSQFKEDLIKFVNRDCAIVCVECECEASIAKRGPTVPFNMQVLGPR